MLESAVAIFLSPASGAVEGWSTYEMAPASGGLASLAGAVWETFMIGMLPIPDPVREGELDECLVRPASPLLLVLSREVEPDTPRELALALGPATPSLSVGQA